MDKRVSTSITPFLRKGYLVAFSICVIMFFFAPVGEVKLTIAMAGIAICILLYVFYHNLWNVTIKEDCIRCERGGKIIDIEFAGIESVQVEQMINLQPVRIITKNNDVVRFVSAASSGLFWANMELVEELRAKASRNKPTADKSEPTGNEPTGQP